MLQTNITLIFFFSYKKSIKMSNTRLIINSFTETTEQKSFNYLVLKHKSFESYFFQNFFFIKERRELLNILLKDMIHLILAWRHIRGYPQGGNTTHTNANTSKKNKLLLNYRIQQFFKMFGQKRRNIYPTLVKAEYTNRLWYFNWYAEWKQASVFAYRMADKGLKFGVFNPVLLAGNQTNGYKRVGKAAKIGKAKKLVKVYTIGVPLLFARYIYMQNTPIGFPRIVLKDEVSKRMGKKFHRREMRNK